MKTWHIWTWVVAGALVLALSLGLTVAPATVRAATYTVNAADDTDDGACNAAHCSLREAINAANASPVADTIAFNIPGAGPHTIQPATGLPILSGSFTTLDGYTQPGATPATGSTSAVLKIEIDGSAVNDPCLRVIGSQNTIRGLVINRCGGDGIWLYPSGSYQASGNTIAGNHIGTDVAGTADRGCLNSGVHMDGGGSNNTVGGTAPADRNVISGNDGYGGGGVNIAGAGTDGNTVVGNYLGSDATGTAALGNSSYGLNIVYGAKNNVVHQNLISGNHSHGLHLSDPGSDGNQIWGNLIGTDKTGAAALGNGYEGVYVGYEAANNLIGGSTADKRNVISGNGRHGVLINSGHNTVAGNYIGLDVTGAAGLSNGEVGVYLDGGHDNLIGGSTAGERNVISANGQYGLVLRYNTATGNIIRGNYIGTDAGGAAGLGNAWNGLFLYDQAHDNTIGPDNVISANGWSGLSVAGAGVVNNTVTGNRIGTNAAGTGTLPNGGDAIFVTGGVVGMTIGPDNLIAYHSGNGVTVDGNVTWGVAITRNSIHANAWGIRLHNGGNQSIAAPVITGITYGGTGAHVSGTACADCTVELFANPDSDGEGKFYIGSAPAGGGTFTVNASSLPAFYLTATATDATKGTSEFSAVYAAPAWHRLFLPLVLRQSP